jgi:hypothetical protein
MLTQGRSGHLHCYLYQVGLLKIKTQKTTKKHHIYSKILLISTT